MQIHLARAHCANWGAVKHILALNQTVVVTAPNLVFCLQQVKAFYKQMAEFVESQVAQQPQMKATAS